MEDDFELRLISKVWDFFPFGDNDFLICNIVTKKHSDNIWIIKPGKIIDSSTFLFYPFTFVIIIWASIMLCCMIYAIYHIWYSICSTIICIFQQHSKLSIERLKYSLQRGAVFKHHIWGRPRLKPWLFLSSLKLSRPWAAKDRLLRPQTGLLPGVGDATGRFEDWWPLHNFIGPIQQRVRAQ